MDEEKIFAKHLSNQKSTFGQFGVLQTMQRTLNTQ